jgi:hypothetical protein
MDLDRLRLGIGDGWVCWSGRVFLRSSLDGGDGKRDWWCPLSFKGRPYFLSASLDLLGGDLDLDLAGSLGKSRESWLS